MNVENIINAKKVENRHFFKNIINNKRNYKEFSTSYQHFVENSFIFLLKNIKNVLFMRITGL